MGRPLRLPLTIFKCAGVAARQSLSRDQLANCNLGANQQQRSNDIGHEQHATTVPILDRRNPAPYATLSQVPKLVVRN